MVQAAAEGHLNVVGYLLSCDWPGPSDLLRNQSHQSLVAAASNGHINVRIYSVPRGSNIVMWLNNIMTHFETKCASCEENIQNDRVTCYNAII